MNKVKSVLFVAGISLALAFTFSCSGDSGGNGNGEQSNISSGTEASTETSSSSLSDSGGSSSGKGSEVGGSVKKEKISGLSQKGPFTRGSAITLYELNDKLAQTGRSFEEIITDDKGSFEIKNIELVSPYVMFKVNGFYRNEVTGKISTAPINLYAIADIREKNNINVNILTHLEYYRVQKLVEEGRSLKDAKKQAQKEILAVFGISGEFKDSEDMSIFGTTDGDAALLAISVLLQGELSEGQFVERLADFNLGFKETGAWDNKAAKDAIANWAAGGNANSTGGSGDYCDYGPSPEYPTNNCWPMPTKDMCQSGRLVKSCSNSGNTSDTAASSLAKVRSNILGWNLSSAVPDFEKYVNNYWYVNYGLGNCDADLQNSIKSNNKKVDYICKNNAWIVATEYERDTYQWVCVEGEIKAGQASGKKYICKSSAWTIATEAEVQVGLCSKDGEIKSGANGIKYICKSKVWAIATEYELDTYQWVCTEGEIKDGQASGKKYICRNENWQTPPRNIEIKCFESKSCSTFTFTDVRDNQRYLSVTIGRQTWMTENMNYNAAGSVCSDCGKYGRLYNWETAMVACPAGWHLPSNAEWDELLRYVDGSSGTESPYISETAGKYLKTESGWLDYYGKSGNGTDDFGFSALPAGNYSPGSYGGSGMFNGVGNYGFWWSSSDDGEFDVYDWCESNNNAYFRGISNGGGRVSYDCEGKSNNWFSVRCLQDSP